MKVLNIIEEGRFGGPQRRIIEIAKCLQAYQIETVVILPELNSEQFLKELTKNNIRYHAIPLHRLTKDRKHLFQFFKGYTTELKSIREIIKKEKPTLIHCNGAWQFKGVLAARNLDCKIVWHMNDMSMPFFIKGVFQMMTKTISMSYLVSCQKAIDFYFSKEDQKKFDIQIARPPVNTNLFNPDIVNPTSDIEQLPGIKIITVGNINPIKGYPTFLEAIKLVNQSINPADVSFVVVGKWLKNQTKLNQEIKSFIETNKIENIHFLGARNDIANLLKSSDLFICPSYAETGPMSVFEALSMKLPVIASDVADLDFIFDQAESGIVVPIKDAPAMAKGILNFLSKKSQWPQFGKNARKIAVDLLDVKQSAKDTADLYHRATNAIPLK